MGLFQVSDSLFVFDKGVIFYNEHLKFKAAGASVILGKAPAVNLINNTAFWFLLNFF